MDNSILIADGSSAIGRSREVSNFRAETNYRFFCHSRLQNLLGQFGASIVVVALTWTMAQQSTLIIYLVINQLLVLLTGISFYSRWTNQRRTFDGLPRFAAELGYIRQTFLGSLFWLDLQATQNLTFVLSVLVVLAACLLGSIVTLGPLRRLARPSITCLFLPSALACLFVGHFVIGIATLFFIYVVAIRGSQQVDLAYDELIGLREESVSNAKSLELNNSQLLQANQNLEDEMRRRSLIEADRTQLQGKLLEASRQAGKAEIATGVLHNVGNVMNSVNVSASVLQEDLRKRLLSRLDATIELLGAQNGDLAGFFSNDERAQHFLPYLKQLSGRTEEMVEDFNKLLENIGHVNNVVSSQQSYAMTGAMKATVDPVHVVQSAIHITEERFREQGITVESRFANVTELFIDKSKLLQTLVNILRNAANSIFDSGKEERVITIDIDEFDGHLEIAISDTGVGIAAENIKRIFEHGFSTRSDRGGHGFGLHHAANTINAMGGKLLVVSHGEMQGATFTVQLPVVQSQPQPNSAEVRPS